MEAATTEAVGDEAELANATMPEPGRVVWRAGHDRLVAGDGGASGPYGPEDDTARPTADRPAKWSRGRRSIDDQGMHG